MWAAGGENLVKKEEAETIRQSVRAEEIKLRETRWRCKVPSAG